MVLSMTKKQNFIIEIKKIKKFRIEPNELFQS